MRAFSLELEEAQDPALLVQVGVVADRQHRVGREAQPAPQQAPPLGERHEGRGPVGGGEGLVASGAREDQEAGSAQAWSRGSGRSRAARSRRACVLPNRAARASSASPGLSPPSSKAQKRPRVSVRVPATWRSPTCSLGGARRALRKEVLMRTRSWFAAGMRCASSPGFHSCDGSVARAPRGAGSAHVAAPAAAAARSCRRLSLATMAFGSGDSNPSGFPQRSDLLRRVR